MSQFDHPDQLRHRTRLSAKLVFDTADRAVSAGTRRRENSSRHLLYEVENLCLDLRLDQTPQSAAALIVGQLADRRDPLKPLAGLPVYLVAGSDFLAHTTSNRLGEFQLSYIQSSDETSNQPSESAGEAEPGIGDSMSLCLAIGDEEVIEVPMDPPADHGS